MFYIVLFFLATYLFARLRLGRCTCNTYLLGKTALITGGNSGLGYETALALAGRGCRVIIADKDNCDESKAAIIQETGNSNIVTKQFDLSSLESVRRLAKDINETEQRLDILINNAGTSSLGNKYTEDGLHMTMQINHFGGFLLTHLLIDLLKKSAPSKIIFVSSLLAFINQLTLENLNYPEKAPTGFLSELEIYSNSKLCNIITAQEFAKKLEGTGVTCNSVHPGLIYTKIFAKELAIKENLFQVLRVYLLRLILVVYAKTVQEGAQTAIHVALSKTYEKTSGEYLVDCKNWYVPAKAKDKVFAKNIWEATEKYVKLKAEEKINNF